MQSEGSFRSPSAASLKSLVSFGASKTRANAIQEEADRYATPTSLDLYQAKFREEALACRLQDSQTRVHSHAFDHMPRG
jgi:hypothetical protein